jgi:hypothetical protein
MIICAEIANGKGGWSLSAANSPPLPANCARGQAPTEARKTRQARNTGAIEGRDVADALETFLSHMVGGWRRRMA